MPLPAGTTFGPYELVAPLGAGGMGEVFRARDPRLGREVAVKILRTDAALTADRVRRFEQEARAAGSLNHPNVLAVFDVGTQAGKPYVVTELLEGETLRARLDRGALPPRKTLELALQIARGLAAAHEKGIVHRDLKPENIFLTRDGRVKILDFGLAKLVEPMPASALLGDATPAAPTEPGVVLGTAGYMAPEQVRGDAADGRSDLFALGALLYEMLSGRRAFAGETRIAILYGIAHAEPSELQHDGALSAALDAVLRHCLEKRPEDRFQSARDLAFQLEQLGGTSSNSGRMRTLPAGRKPRPGRRVALLAAAGALAAGLLGGFGLAARLAARPAASYRQLTFRRGVVRNARFAPDGQTVVYAAAFDAEETQLFSTSSRGVGSRALGFVRADLLSVSPGGELALSLWLVPGPSTFVRTGTLSRVPLAGGAPRELLEHVNEADWAGDELAVVRQVQGRFRLELPQGHLLAESAGWISSPRVSPGKDLVAFIDHPLYGDDRGAVAVVDLQGHKRVLSSQYTSTQGTAWRGAEVWFTGGEGIARALRAVRLDGTERVVASSPATLSLYDVSPEGRVLLGREAARAGVVGRDGAGLERDLSWLDFTVATGLSRESGLFSFFEAGEGGGEFGAGYVRKLSGAPAVRLGPGYAWDLSRDGKTVVLFSPKEPRKLRLVPTGAGEARTIDLPLERVTGARFLPDGQRLVVSGSEAGKGARLFVLDKSGLRAFSPEGMRSVFYTVAPVSPDGTRIVAQGVNGAYAVYPLDGSPARPMPLADIDRPQGWADDRTLYVHRPRELPVRVDRLDVMTGRRERYAELSPADLAGIEQVGPVFFGPDGKVLLYGYVRTLSELYVAEGLR